MFNKKCSKKQKKQKSYICTMYIVQCTTYTNVCLIYPLHCSKLFEYLLGAEKELYIGGVKNDSSACKKKGWVWWSRLTGGIGRTGEYCTLIAG